MRKPGRKSKIMPTLGIGLKRKLSLTLKTAFLGEKRSL